ncbi:MAG: EI24 domain-containing protein [Campylobacterales bacterium]|nr:EI24 domain-containing protein [Campylobacterales bacterium]
MAKTLSLGLKDIVSWEVMSFVLKIGLVSILAWGGVLYFYWSELLAIVTSYLSFIPWEWLKTTGAGIATVVVGYILIITTVSILTSLYSEELLKKLAKKHYGVEANGNPSVMGSMMVNIKANLVFLGVFILFFWMIFIPIIGQIFMLYLWSIQIKSPTVYDVGTLFINDKELLRQKAKKARVLSIVPSAFNYIPLLNIFAPIYLQILFLHHILND